MTKKLQRKLDYVFEESGETGRSQRAMFKGGAAIHLEDGHAGQDRIFISTDHFYTKEALDELIAELLFLKEEWENHPVYLEQEQAEDMEEIAEEGLVGPDEQERIMQEEEDLIAEFENEDQPNPFNQEVQREHQQRMEELIRQVQRQRHNIPR